MHFKKLLVDFSFELYTQCEEKQRLSGNPPLTARILDCRSESNFLKKDIVQKALFLPRSHHGRSDVKVITI